MVRQRARKIAGIAREIPPTEIFGDADGGDLVMLGWGSTLRVASRGGEADARQGQERFAHPSALSESAPERSWRSSCASSKR